MRRGNTRWTIPVMAILCMLLLIFDAKTAVTGAREGIEISLYTVIPSLFPFIVLSSLISGSLLGRRIPFFCRISKLCGVPDGAESLLLLGLLGGYPVGAQVVTEAYRSGQLDEANAKRMLGFCNNAGPAFLFGMISPMFSKTYTVFILWGIHILSALLTGILLPGRKQDAGKVAVAKPISVPEALEKAITIIARICGWVVLFRVMLTFCDRWIFNCFPPAIQVLLAGFCELSNGCIGLNVIESESMRFIVSSSILAAGGLCVAMQTASVTKDLGTGMYFPGKIIQTGISILFSCCIAPLLFPGERPLFRIPLLLCSTVMVLGLLVIFVLFRKKGGNLQMNGV